MKKFLLITILISSITLMGQNIPKLQNPDNPFIKENSIEIESGGGVIIFKMNTVKVGELFTKYLSYTGLSNNDSMVNVRTWSDSILEDDNSPAPNLIHNEYQQYYKGVLVEGATYTEHHDGINLWTTSGFIFENLDLNTTPNLSKENATIIARNYTGVFSFTDNSTSGLLTIIPQPNKEITGSKDFVLAWKFVLIGDTVEYNSNIYVDATTGQVIKEISNIYNDDFIHKYYGRIFGLDTKEYCNVLGCTYYLYAHNGSKNIYTNTSYPKGDYKNGGWQIGDMVYNNGTPNWWTVAQEATSTHYCVSRSWDYFHDTPLNRNGISGWGNHVRVYVNSQLTENDYQSDGSQDYILVGTTGAYIKATYDLIGHEFTHGIIYRTKPLPAERVSGAIFESFCDIFGFMVEQYAQGYVNDWTIGEDYGITERDIQYPNLSPNINPNNPAYYTPSHYLDSYWNAVSMSTPANNTNDNGWIHKNLGVQNRWFYLLSMGGNEKVNNQNRYVGAIGINKAARIAYYAMTNLDNYNPLNNTNFNAVRASTIAAAKILYGICSNEYEQTCRAWYAVNVGISCNPCPNVMWYRQAQSNTFASADNIKKLTNNIGLYPNPSKDNVSINIDSKNDAFTLKIFNIKGELLFSNIYTQNKFNINVSDFVTGVYIVNVTTNEWTKNIKFIKE